MLRRKPRPPGQSVIAHPSPQQHDFFEWIQNGRGSAVLEAVAGSGKTTTLLAALEMMQGRIYFGAYNKKIAEEIRERAPNRQGLFVGTMHSAGFKAWARATSNLTVDNKKVQKICRMNDVDPDLEAAVCQLVSLAKQRAFDVVTPKSEAAWRDTIDHHNIETLERDAQVIELAEKVLQLSTQMDTQVIDFDDMIYAPLLHKARVFEHDWVLIDEAQDTNAARRALALRMLSRGGRLVAVGDRHQAIYGFTGADADALDLIGRAVNAQRLPLTVTYRCPKSVVRHAQRWVSHIEAHESAPEGRVISWQAFERAGEAVMERESLALVGHGATEWTHLPKVGDAVLCRFNRPLIELAFDLISQGKPAKVEGRDIGEGLKTLARRWKVKSLDALIKKLETYREKETAKLRAKERESQAATVDDKVDCLLLLISRTMAKGGSVFDLLAEIDSIFSDDGDSTNRIILSSIHKSKGREWSRVFWMQTGTSPWARKEWEQEQERNLCYVATTRAKSDLILVPA